jgi:hypothetical protein
VSVRGRDQERGENSPKFPFSGLPIYIKNSYFKVSSVFFILNGSWVESLSLVAFWMSKGSRVVYVLVKWHQEGIVDSVYKQAACFLTNNRRE